MMPKSGIFILLEFLEEFMDDETIDCMVETFFNVQE